jgi:hypothetical protein
MALATFCHVGTSISLHAIVIGFASAVAILKPTTDRHLVEANAKSKRQNLPRPFASTKTECEHVASFAFEINFLSLELTVTAANYIQITSLTLLTSHSMLLLHSELTGLSGSVTTGQ